ASFRARRRWPGAPPRRSWRSSSHGPERVEVGELVLVLAGGALFFSWSADRPKIAEPAGVAIRVRRSRQKPLFDGAVDDLQDVKALASRVVVDDDRVLVEAAGRGR